jgi:hypothetical protein
LIGRVDVALVRKGSIFAFDQVVCSTHTMGDDTYVMDCVDQDIADIYRDLVSSPAHRYVSMEVPFTPTTRNIFNTRPTYHGSLVTTEAPYAPSLEQHAAVPFSTIPSMEQHAAAVPFSAIPSMEQHAAAVPFSAIPSLEQQALVFAVPPSRIMVVKHPSRDKDIDYQHAARVASEYNNEQRISSVIPKNKNTLDADELMLTVKLVNLLRDSGHTSATAERFAALLPNRACLRCVTQGKHGDVVKGQMYCSPCIKSTAKGQQAPTLEDAIIQWIFLADNSKCYDIKTL